MSTIEIKEISKQFSDVTALDDVSLTIEPNKIYGLLGRNGAGKTTLLNLLTNKIFPTSGDITINGQSVFNNDTNLNNLYYMMEKNLYPEGFKVKEIFKWTKEFYPLFDMDYAYSLANKFSLALNKKIKQLSTGYNSIFKAIVALSVNAEIIIFDEPVLGLDANHREIFYKELIANYSQNPRTIIISTHLIEEAANLLEEVIILKEGKVILKQSVEQLLSSAYNVSGEAEKVNRYLDGKKYVGVETLGKFKSATVLESIQTRNDDLAKELDIDFNKVELQKLFISLTN